MNKYKRTEQLAHDILLSVTETPRNWVHYLNTAAHLYKYSAQEQLLIYAQRPTATAVAPIELWNKRFGRLVRRGTQAISLIDENSSQEALRYVFDISDTIEMAVSRDVPIWQLEPQYTAGVTAVFQTAMDGILPMDTSLPVFIHGWAKQMTRDCIDFERLQSGNEATAEYIEFIASSATYMALTRCGLDASVLHENLLNSQISTLNIYKDSVFLIQEETATIIVRNTALVGGEVIRVIEEQIKLERGNSNEQSEQRHHLSPTGGLSSTQPDLRGGDSNGGTREIRLPAEGMVKDQSGRQVLPDGNQRGVASTPPRTGDESSRDGLSESGDTDGGGEESSRQDDTANGVVGENGQPDQTGGSGDFSRDTVRKIIEDELRKEAVDNTSTTSFLIVTGIPELLRYDRWLKADKTDVVAFFKEHDDITERAEYLKSIYNKDYTEVLDANNNRFGYHKDPAYLSIWANGYLNPSERAILEWEEVAERVDDLIQRHEYLTAPATLVAVETQIELLANDNPILAEQLSFFNMEPIEPLQEGQNLFTSLFKHEPIPQDVIDGILSAGGSRKHSTYRILGQYLTVRPDAENIAFLQGEFLVNEGRGILYNERQYAAWFTEEGIHFAQGDSVHTGRSKTLLSWADCSKRIVEILERGGFASELEFQLNEATIYADCADSLINLARDLSDEGKEQEYLNTPYSIYREKSGFPASIEALVEYMMESPDHMQTLLTEYNTYLQAIENDSSILRYRYTKYHNQNIEVALRGILFPKRELFIFLESPLEPQLLITNDEVTHFFLSERKEDQLDVYSYFCREHRPADRQAFIEERYGTFSGSSHYGYSTLKSTKGLEYKRDYQLKEYGKVQLTFPQIVKHYERLIAEKRYPSAEAMDFIPEYQCNQVGNHIRSAYHGIMDESLFPYPQKLDFHSASAWIANQLVNADNVVELKGRLQTLQDGTNPDNRYYDYIETAVTSITQWENGRFDVFNGRHPERMQYQPSAPQIATAQTPMIVQVAPVLDVVARVASPISLPKVTFKITDDELGTGTPTQKLQCNMSAIQLIKTLETESRPATAEEQETLSQYVGWGGLSNGFKEGSDTAEELQALLTPEEYKLAEESTLTAFYTPPVVVRAMYDCLADMGVRSGNLLDPACGTGHFFGMLPDDMREGIKPYGVELDSVTGAIATQLYPNAKIQVQGFETSNVPDNFFDVVIGNVPFGDFSVADRKYDKHHFKIHDYFFAKSLDKVRTGGIVAFVTSKGTMDKKSSAVRQYIANRAELLGAVRLPNNTFSRNAGTEVTSDILFLKRREGIIESDDNWIMRGTHPIVGEINKYYIDHPEMVVGELAMQSGPFGMESTCTAVTELPLAEQLRTALKHIRGHIELPVLSDELEDVTGASIPADPTVKNFSYTIVEDNIYYRENSIMHKENMPRSKYLRVCGLIGVRDIVQELIERQVENCSNDELTELQQELESRYSRYVKSFGLLSARGNRLAFIKDIGYPLLSALEELDKDGNLKSKSDIFTKRTIRQAEAISHVDTAVDALTASISEYARVNLEYMEKLTGHSEEKLLADLHGLIYPEPFHTDENDKPIYLDAGEYLSGNVRKKLELAKLASEDNPIFIPNVTALEQSLPTDLTASEIDVRLGATWIPPHYVEQWMFETIETPFAFQRHMGVQYISATAAWYVKGKSEDRSTNIKATVTYGTKDISAYGIIESSLNLKAVLVMDTVDDKPVINPIKTRIAQQKQDALKENFRSWIFRDPERREKLVRDYNDRFNNLRPRIYNGDHIRFVGMTPDKELRPHQTAAVARMLYGGNTLLAHCVGAGKTYEMIAAGMEEKRLGLCAKSMFVVPNHLIGQFADEFLALYPAANLLVARKRDFEKHNRQRFCVKIATGEWDGVILGHSQFERIPMSPESESRMLKTELKLIMAEESKLKAEKAENFTVKQMMRLRIKTEVRLRGLSATSKKDGTIFFEQLGIDRIYIDEAHLFKNLMIRTKMRNVAGIGSTPCDKAMDLFLKCRYLDSVTNGVGIRFATGTPISNSMSELYTMMRYLQYDYLEQTGMLEFDSWASNFGESVTAMELAPEGTRYRMKTRFSKFFNLPELMTGWRESADIVTADMLDVPVPKVTYHTEVCPPSEIQKHYVSDLAMRAGRVRSGSVDANIDDMLKVTHDGRKLALDQRLVNSDYPDAEHSKATMLAHNAHQIWEQSTDVLGTQLVFCDLSTPKNRWIPMDERVDGAITPFSIYHDIKDKLVAQGIPPEEIAYIHDADTDIKKQVLFNQMREGEIRILLGSTAKLGAGTNVQNKLIALHHIDVPWKPSDIEQREGRIIRRGNNNPSVDIYRYVTEGTFDAYSWQLIESKQRFIGQIMTGKAIARSCDDIDSTALSYAEVKALATGNPMIKEKMELDIEVAKLTMLKKNYENERYTLEDSILKSMPFAIAGLEQRIELYQSDIKELGAKSATENFSIEVLGKPYQKKEMAGDKLLLICQSYDNRDIPLEVGSYRGMKLYATAAGRTINDPCKLMIKNHGSYVITLGEAGLGVITRIDNALNQLPELLTESEQHLVTKKKQLEDAKTELTHEWPHEKELLEKMARLKEVEMLLTVKEKKAPEQEQSQNPADELEM